VSAETKKATEGGRRIHVSTPETGKCMCKKSRPPILCAFFSQASLQILHLETDVKYRAKPGRGKDGFSHDRTVIY